MTTYDACLRVRDLLGRRCEHVGGSRSPEGFPRELSFCVVGFGTEGVCAVDAASKGSSCELVEGAGESIRVTGLVLLLSFSLGEFDVAPCCVTDWVTECLLEAYPA